MTDPNPIVAAGIDVGKSKLDAHILNRGLDRQFNNDKPGPRSAQLAAQAGRFPRRLRTHRTLPPQPPSVPRRAGLETVLVNPLRSRRFAEAIGHLAKNDRVDAAMLARFGLFNGLESTPPSSATSSSSATCSPPPQARRAARRPAQALRRTRPPDRRPLCHARGPPSRHHRLRPPHARLHRRRRRSRPPRRHHPVGSRLRARQCRLPLCRHARTRPPRPPQGCLPVRGGTFRPRFRTAPRWAQHWRRARPAAPPALHGSLDSRPARSRPARPATNASWLAASRTRWPWSPSCADWPRCSTPPAPGPPLAGRTAARMLEATA